MGSFFRKGSDNLLNGTIIGMIVGALVVWGQRVYDFVVPMIPESWMIFGEFSVPVILIAIGGLIGYIVDRV